MVELPLVMLVALTSAPAAQAAVPPAAVAEIVAKDNFSGGRDATAAPRRRTTAIGSGFVIDPSGFVATNKHVFEAAVAVTVVTADGVRHVARIVGMTAKADMALLQVDAETKLPSLTFGDSNALRVGETVIAIGSPFGFNNSVTTGVVSAVNRNIMESPFDDYIQTDAPINHGNSGGPLFNMQGQVVGMNSVWFAPGAETGSVGVGFAIPSNDLDFVRHRLIADGKIAAGMLPIRTQPVTWMIQQALGTSGLQGAQVAALEPGGEQMLNQTIKAGDVILSFNGRTVLDPRDLALQVARAPVGTDATLTISRGGTQQVVHATIQAWPEATFQPLTRAMPRTLGLQLTASPEAGVSVAAVDPAGSAADSASTRATSSCGSGRSRLPISLRRYASCRR